MNRNWTRGLRWSWTIRVSLGMPTLTIHPQPMLPNFYSRRHVVPIAHDVTRAISAIMGVPETSYWCNKCAVHAYYLGIIIVAPVRRLRLTPRMALFARARSCARGPVATAARRGHRTEVGTGLGRQLTCYVHDIYFPCRTDKWYSLLIIHYRHSTCQSRSNSPRRWWHKAQPDGT